MSSPPVINIQPDDTIASAAARITPTADSLIVLLGCFDAPLAAQVRSFCSRAVVPIALMAKALIIDDGASPGLAAEMGAAARQMDESPMLLAILDPGVAAPGLDHQLLLRLPASWPDASKARIQIVTQLASPGDGREKPVIVLLFGGKVEDTMTVLRCARRGWTIFPVQGAGGLGDAILAARAAAAEGQLIDDADVAEILSTATVCPLPLNSNGDDLNRLLLQTLRQPVEVLVDAWSRFDVLDLAANDKQREFHRVQLAMLVLAVVATLLAVLISWQALPGFFAGLTPMAWGRVRQGLHILLILVPITLSVLSGFNSRFREGNKWVLLRAAAESIKREIFRYRAKAGVYSPQQCLQVSAQSKLAANLKAISESLAQSEVNRSSLASREVENPARLTLLTPGEFLRLRVEDQQSYLVTKTKKLYKRLKSLQVSVLVAGGLGTLLAAIHLDVWVALTTALATALTARLEIDQVETSLVQYNVALTNLNNIRSWWIALTSWEKTRQRNIDVLVDETEKTLERETAGWVQQMQSALDKLTEKQDHADQQSTSAPRR